MALLAAAASWFVYLMPYGAFGRVFGGSVLDTLATLASVAAPFAIIVIAAAILGIQRRRDLALLRHASVQPIAPENIWLADQFRQFGVQIAVLGDVVSVVDPGGPVLSSPRLVATGLGQNREFSIVVPALAYLRLTGDRGALDAVLAHEYRHILGRDLFWFVAFERLLQVTLWIVPMVVLLNVASSTLYDVDAGQKLLSALSASLLGKSSIVVLPVLVAISIAVLNVAVAYREAAADHFARWVGGSEALVRAEHLLSGGTVVSRPWRGMSVEKMRADWRLVALFGFALGSFTSLISGPLAYWQSVLPQGLLSQGLALGYALAAVAIPYVGAFAVGRVVLRQSPSGILGAASTDIGVLLLFAGMVAAGYTLPQTVPGMLTSIPLLDDYPNLFRSDPWRLLLSSIAESGIIAICTTSAGALFAAASMGGRAGWWFAAGTATVLAGIVEPVVTNGYFLGLACFLPGSIFCLLAIRRWRAQLRPGSWSLLSRALVAAIACIIAASWFGLGGPGSIAISLQARSNAAEANGDGTGAEKFALAATYFASLTGTSHFNLGKLQLERGKPFGDAIESFERGLAAPFLSDWLELFSAHTLAATGYLERREADDWDRADKHLATAREMWRRSVRLDLQDAVVVQYNSAVIECNRTSPDVLAGLVFVAEAAALASKIAEPQAVGVAQIALTDGDLLPLDLNAPTKIKAETLSAFGQVRGRFQEAVDQALARGMPRDQAIDFLRSMVQRTAATGPH
ncbi:hypothetical protein [Rhizobium herbae]|uniref:Peptidase M48 domain-containing protein n=1 Tax=Rhizobium herbae TaxID=508661 RepID=A0ABS4EUD5_9HYPH|nr:hypothetical protein [Rhizobium herbae]MBP1861564.1 hypothetical protein [Rhizobium herbae]